MVKEIEIDNKEEMKTKLATDQYPIDSEDKLLKQESHKDQEALVLNKIANEKNGEQTKSEFKYVCEQSEPLGSSKKGCLHPSCNYNNTSTSRSFSHVDQQYFHSEEYYHTNTTFLPPQNDYYYASNTNGGYCPPNQNGYYSNVRNLCPGSYNDPNYPRTRRERSNDSCWKFIQDLMCCKMCRKRY